jgi:eukaryotic-like serine/threonine-protein kinase
MPYTGARLDGPGRDEARARTKGAPQDHVPIMSEPEASSASTRDSTLSWGGTSPAPRARDLTGAALGDFQVDRLLGRGGMGEVYLARQSSLNREVALKVLRPDLTNPLYLDRFEAEAWAAAKLNHPNIVHIYTLGVFDGLRFIAMEYVQGTNLREYLLRKGPPDLPQALSIMRQAAAAVGAAGEVGLVHRDIKPENLLLTKKGQVKVADFGLCRDLDSDKHHVTQPGVTMGTPLYMSPEQARGHEMDHRSDLYSLGVTYYHMLAGHPPFRAETALALAMKHVVDTPIDLSVHRPDLPPELCRLVMKLMAKLPADRYQSAAEMLRDLGKIRENLQITALAAASGGTIAPPIKDDIAAIDTSPRPKTGSKPEVEPATIVPRLSWPSSQTMALAGIIGLALGLLVGWSTRPADLLTTEAGARPAPPALWIAPDWEKIEKKESPAAQYRFAQVQAGGPDRLAAWVAVSGYYPDDPEWDSKSYSQLARELFLVRDRDRLNAFANVLGTTHYGRNEVLTQVMIAGIAEIDGDAEKVLGYFDNNSFNVVNNFLDPANVDFALEIILRLREDAPRYHLTGWVKTQIEKTQSHLIQRLIEIKKHDLQG